MAKTARPAKRSWLRNNFQNRLPPQPPRTGPSGKMIMKNYHSDLAGSELPGKGDFMGQSLKE